MMVTFSRNFITFWCMVCDKSTSITYNHFYFFSIFVHPMAEIFYGEVHKYDSNMLKRNSSQSNLLFESYA